MNSSPLEISDVENEFEAVLYLHHFHSGPNVNQETVLKLNGNDGFGALVVQDWRCRAGRGFDTEVIARAQGIHVQASNEGAGSWYNSFNLVFVKDGFEGSTLEVKGTNVTDGEWAIVGGTGKFTNAKGVIYKKKVDHFNDGDIMEITIKATYSPMEKPKSA
ncbi:hypothetical protein LUZ61_001031 [Rhynchospora tenuis]|uniref:Dirigent protein n=1 Tax=Rhynchospora tenuis TaxID=198213 RepID=A0AAD5ZGG4_9POAL|nr:hypothetical protein LUZ61_001031 [Rhynchospora tenuis]